MSSRSICLLFVLALTSVARAQTAESLDEGEKVLVRRMSATSQVEQRYGRIVRGRRAFVEDPSAVAGAAGTWQAGARSWILGWMRVLGLADLREELEYDAFQSTLTDLLQKQATELEGLRRRAVPLASDADQAALLFSSVTAVPDAPELAPYRAIVDRMLQVEASSRAAAQQTRSYVVERLAELERIDAVSRRLVAARLEAALIATARYPLDTALRELRALLDVEGAVDPVIARLGAWERELNEHAIKLHVFHARRAIDEARRTCSEARGELARFSAPAGFVRGAREHAERLCRAAEGHFGVVTGLGVPDWQLVAETLRVEQVELDALCAKAKNPVLGCERLATLAALPEGHLQAMSPAQLEFVETEWVRNLARAKGGTP